jgi:hypothetical protein
MKKNYLLILFALFISVNIVTAGSISEPKFGQYTVGDDYFLANYTQLIEYWGKLEKESDRIKIIEIGKTSEGRPQKIAIITSPENLKKLKRYQEISVKLGKAEGLTDEQAHALALEGKAVVAIDGGLHATESVNAQALFSSTYDLLSKNDEETKRILDNVILLLIPSNPDGQELVSNWYMRESDPKKRNQNIPTLYQKYVGHDNNRDSYIANQTETENLNRLFFIDWIPQITYNQHQSGPAGSVLFISPFRDPFNYNQDPLVPIGIELVSSAVHNRFLTEGKGGAVTRDAAPYSTWFNGGVRTAVGFHNQIGLMHEIIGSPTPMSIPLVATKLLPDSKQPLPIGPQQIWHLRQSIDYVISADRAILDIAAKFREDFLYRIYVAGKNSIERGSKDYWTVTPKRIAALEAESTKYKEEQKKNQSNQSAGEVRGGRGGQNIPAELWTKLNTPESRDPRGYIIPSDQVDFLTATKFVNALLKGGVDVHRATTDFQVAGKTYPAGSYVVKAAQAFRPHLRDLFEPQDHPNDLEYPGGPPKRPYDLAGYTLAYQFDIKFDRILDAFDGPFEKINGLLKAPAGKIKGASSPKGYLLSHQINDAFTGTTKLLASGQEVYWLTSPLTIKGKKYPVGTIYIPAKSTTGAAVQKLASEIGLNFDAISSKPHGEALKLRPVKVALWDKYGGSMDSGWIRWLLETQFSLPFEVVYPAALDSGKLHAKYDVIILPEGAFPQNNAGGRSSASEGGEGGRYSRTDNVPAEFKNRVGNISLNKTAPQLREFVEEGGVILTVGTSSTGFGKYLDLPFADALVEKQADGSEKKISSDKYYVPGSVLRVKVDNTIPIAYGVSEDLDILFSNDPVFRLLPEAKQKGLNPVAWFPNAEPLRSGWALGQNYLNSANTILETSVGKGKVFLFGPDITFRGQSHGSFKFLFNGIYQAGAKTVKL